jgi:endonuclease-8
VPEGDTIFRAARALHRALHGGAVRRFSSVFPALERVHLDRPLTGRRVESVESRGKHLLIHFEGGLALRTHMRMSGSWHLYRPGERWRRAARDLRIVIETADFVAVAFNVQDAEFLDPAGLARQPSLAKLGPDLLAPEFDAAQALARLRARGATAIESALLDQRALAGIGNVYKSEALFACRVHPFAPVATLSDAQLEELIEAASGMLRANVAHAPAPGAAPSGARRTTRRMNPAERLWVYGRSGRPCRCCGAPIARLEAGPNARTTYWCPACQPAPA